MPLVLSTSKTAGKQDNKLENVKTLFSRVGTQHILMNAGSSHCKLLQSGNADT